MLVIYVISSVIGYIIYTVIKVKLEDWRRDTRMSRLSLKRHQLADGMSVCSNSPPRIISDTIEISSDESDISEEYKIVESDSETMDKKVQKEDYDEETLYKFQKSTDSIQSDEEVAESSLPANSKPMTSMFNWKQKRLNLNKNSTRKRNNSSSSDESNQRQTPFQQRYENKKYRNNQAIIPPSKSKPNDNKEEALPEVGVQYEQMISGIKVKLPVKPYSSQIAVMNKLIQGCTKMENCLLESPTGSGKTLALLCGVLAWHDRHVAEMKKQIDARSRNDGPTTMTGNSGDYPGYSGKKCVDELDDCCQFDKFKDAMEDMKSDKVKISKIYYGTRTHKQIEQVVRELQKTCYKNKRMTILSSREHTCIQDSNRNKTELCNELLDPTKAMSCPFYNELNKKNSIFHFTAHQLGPVWDIEDLVAIGRENKWCPYFAARNLMEFADIIFCPYNYIIDPDIRASMQLDLKDQVIILDEAHNIEDICRDVASVSFRDDHLSAAANDCESLTKQRSEDSSTYSSLKAYIFKLVEFLKNISLNKVDYNSDNLSSPYWTGIELLELFNMHELGESAYSTFLVACKAALADVEKEREDSRMLVQKTTKPVISTSTKIIIEHLMFAIRMITSKEYINDYRACVTETTVKDFKMTTDNTWLSAKKCEQRVRTLKLLCMNPGVIFSPLAQNARCIILASGTLTPTASFQSELRTSFVHVLNTGHVIPKEQVYATCVPKGPNGIHLRANYQAVNSWAFQDELGRVLLDVCESIPHGILCFFSSYNVMHTQIGRWKNNSIWNNITNVKQVFIEPRYGNDLTAIMNEYREVIEDTSDGPREGITGALFLAVFRGKVAEGIDFKDNEARCVITVGIPYAVRKDPVIDMKVNYNDSNSAKGLLRGSGWYCIQAFRALNQALGRCLRHIHDWGAVLLVDERFLMQENKEYLPKWVKTMWVTENEYNLKESLQKFVAKQKAREKKL